MIGILLASVQPVTAKTKEKDFISLAYVALNFLQLEDKEASEVKDILNQYNWCGISDVALIGGVFTAGRTAQCWYRGIKRSGRLCTRDWIIKMILSMNKLRGISFVPRQ